MYSVGYESLTTENATSFDLYDSLTSVQQQTYDPYCTNKHGTHISGHQNSKYISFILLYVKPIDSS